MQIIHQTLAHNEIPAVFTREHDVILVAWPFTVTGQPAEVSPAHTERLQDAVERNFIRSARTIGLQSLAAALEHSSTPELTYRLLPETQQSVEPQAVLLTCAPRSHLALANFLERGVLFSAEVIGRVVRRGLAAAQTEALTGTSLEL